MFLDESIKKMLLSQTIKKENKGEISLTGIGDVFILQK